MYMPNYTGYQFGSYRLLKRIGQGGYADVYEAVDIYLNTRVAIKVLHDSIAPDNQDTILKEAQVIAHMNHPHIVKVIAFNIHPDPQGDIPYFVMTYAPNGALDRLHRKDEQLPWKTIIHYMRQIADALDYIHEQGVIHQDIKPANMLLGADYEILISDFGTVELIQNTGPHNRDKCIGTTSYMAPERFTLDERLSPASDIYSLGVMVFEWLTGKPLFSGSTTRIIHQHIHVVVSSQRMDALQIPRPVQAVLLKALAKKPTDRYRRASDFLAALEQAERVQEQLQRTQKRRADWGEMAHIFILSMIAAFLLGAGLHWALHIALMTALVVFFWFILILPALSALTRRNWVAMTFALLIPVIAAVVGVVLRSLLGFGWTLPILLIISSCIGLYRRYH